MGESVRRRCFNDRLEVARDDASPVEVLEKHTQDATAISNSGRSEAWATFSQKATHYKGRERREGVQSDAFEVRVKGPEMMDVLLDRLIAETTFLTKIREEVRHLIQKRLVWQAATTSADEAWHHELQHLLNRPPQVSCGLFSGPFDDATTAIAAMHPEIDKRLDIDRQLCIVNRSLTPCKRPEIEKERHTLREISR
jgi:hypothetical protein